VNVGDDGKDRPWLLTLPGLAACGALSVIALLLLTEHRAHTIAALPYLLLLACPLMHLFMHRGHGRSRGPHRPRGER
jgi:hypothetical protein